MAAKNTPSSNKEIFYTDYFICQALFKFVYFYYIIYFICNVRKNCCQIKPVELENNLFDKEGKDGQSMFYDNTYW